MSKLHLKESVEFLKKKYFNNPTVGIILGTGLGKLVNEMEVLNEVAYEEIPHFPKSTVEFHKGKLIFGKINNKEVVVMSGRFHLYEGYSAKEVSYGVRVMHGLGIKNLLISNAAGAINDNFKKGNLMLIDDHLNLQGSSPLAYSDSKEFGNIFVDMLEPYSNFLNNHLKNIASEYDINLFEGVYACVIGPQLETRAEYRMLKILGADVVGMSTVPEVIVAKQLNIPCAAISVLTDECNPDDLKPIDINEIISIAGSTEPKLIILFKELIKLL